MLIEAPVVQAESASQLILAGADILYAGLSPKLLFDNELTISSRRPWPQCNIDSLTDLQKIIDIVLTHKKQIYLALNEHFYSAVEAEKILKFIKQFKDISGVILADINLIIEIKNNFPDLKIIGSVGAHVFNSYSAKFFYNLGIQELILPRQLNFQEIKSIIAGFPSLKYGYIIKNDDCPNIDGLCNFSHGVFGESSPCASLQNFRNLSQNINNEQFSGYQQRLRNACSICNVKNLAAAGVEIFKIAGRGKPTGDLIQDILFIKKSLANLDLTEDDYKKNNQALYKNIYKQDCELECLYN